MGHYKSNVRDLEFNLFEVFGTDKLLGTLPELGGHLVPRALVWAVLEQILGANPALHMYGAGAPFASIIYVNGNDAQKRIAQLMIDRGWGATMVLTEPDAGSDVG